MGVGCRLSAIRCPPMLDCIPESRETSDFRLQTSDNQTPLPADWYLPTDESLAAFTEILRFAQNDLCDGKESA